jgi:hypothetical protein
MQFASLLFCMIALLPKPVPTLNGTWVLDRVKSDFGAAGVLRAFDVQIAQAENRLDITVVIADANGERVIQREALPPRLVDGSMWIVSADPTEDWRVTGLGELTIARTVTVKAQQIPQRLVLSRAPILE